MKFKEIQNATEIYYNFCGISPEEYKVESLKKGLLNL